jgi:hypothetical protein
MSRTWRDIAAPIIYEVLKENKGKDEKTIKKALRDAYPFGERNDHPYKIWLDEIKKQTGKKKRKVRGINMDTSNNLEIKF